MRSVSLSIGRGEKSRKGGLTDAGRKKYNEAKDANLQEPVTEKNPTGKRKKRQENFCRRFKGMRGPMKKPNGKPTRKALAMKRWRC